MGKWIKQWKVASSSDPSKVYTISQDTEGGYGCSCKAWTLGRKECRHIREVKAGRVAGGERVPVIDPDELLTVEEPKDDEPDLAELLGGPTKKDRRPLLERLKDSAPWRWKN
jgi:hypothetical protein